MTVIASMRPFTAGLLAALFSATSFATTQGDFSQKGIASYYADRLHGQVTASGERYNKNALTAAHKSLPLGTTVRVTSEASGKSVEVKINDRLYPRNKRVIDLSKRAATELGFARKGVGKVRVEVIGPKDEA